VSIKSNPYLLKNERSKKIDNNSDDEQDSKAQEAADSCPCYGYMRV